MTDRRGKLSIWKTVKAAYGDWVAIIGIPTAAVSILAWMLDAYSMSLSEFTTSIVDAYKTIFHFPFRFLADYLSINTPEWLRSVLVFWVVMGGMGARAYLSISRGRLKFSERSKAMMTDALNSQPMTESLIKRYGSREALDEEMTFLDEQIREDQETLRRANVMRLGCLVTGPLFFLGLLIYNPPLGRYESSARWLLLLDLFAIIGVVVLGMILEWPV